MSTLEFKRTRSSNIDFVKLAIQLDKELSDRYKGESTEYEKYNRIKLVDTAIVVYYNQIPIGCGCFIFYDYKTVEIKRIYITKECRGKGISKFLLAELETWISELGFTKLILRTGIKQPEAIGLYEKSGFIRIENYWQYANIPNSLCYEKVILFRTKPSTLQRCMTNINE